MNPSKVNLLLGIIISILAIGWIVDRTIFRYISDTVEATPKPEPPSPRSYDFETDSYSDFTSYALYHEYLNDPNQIWIHHNVNSEIHLLLERLNENSSSSVLKSIDEFSKTKILRNLRRLWIDEKKYEISEWGVAWYSSKDLARQMLRWLNCNSPTEVRQLARTLMEFQPENKNTQETVGHIGPVPQKSQRERYPEFHLPTSVEFASFDSFLRRVLSDSE